MAKRIPETCLKKYSFTSRDVWLPFNSGVVRFRFLFGLIFLRSVFLTALMRLRLFTGVRRARIVTMKYWEGVLFSKSKPRSPLSSRYRIPQLGFSGFIKLFLVLAVFGLLLVFFQKEFDGLLKELVGGTFLVNGKNLESFK